MQLNSRLGELQQTASLELDNSQLSLKLKDNLASTEQMRMYISQIIKDK